MILPITEPNIELNESIYQILNNWHFTAKELEKIFTLKFNKARPTFFRYFKLCKEHNLIKPGLNTKKEIIWEPTLEGINYLNYYKKEILAPIENNEALKEELTDMEYILKKAPRRLLYFKELLSALKREKDKRFEMLLYTICYDEKYSFIERKFIINKNKLKRYINRKYSDLERQSD